MLSHEEAVDFATNTLNVPITSTSTDQLTLLNQLIQAYQANIPFQSLSLQSRPLEERGKPSFEEIKSDVLSKRGGMCYTLNTFIKYFLEALGYNIYHVTSTKRNTNDHILNIAVISGAQYLVDVGNGYPTFEAIPIDFANESKVYHHSFLEYKFRKGESNTLIRLHKRGDFRPANTELNTDGWRVACIIDLTPRDILFFDKIMTKIYTTPDLLIFHTSIRIVQFPDRHALVIRDTEMYQEDKETHVLILKEKLQTRENIVEKVKIWFPILYEIAKLIKK